MEDPFNLNLAEQSEVESLAFPVVFENFKYQSLIDVQLI